jgi:hypothetical protein
MSFDAALTVAGNVIKLLQRFELEMMLKKRMAL